MKKSQETRLHILQTAFGLIYNNGYQTTSVDEIIAKTNVTKGAFYYHFKTKDEMGLAILNELLKPIFSTNFIEPLKRADDALETIYNLIYHLLINDPLMTLESGCPASNLTQEMAPWNRDFTMTLNELSQNWEQAMIQAIKNSQEKGLINTNADPKEITVFVLSGYWGIRNLGKLETSKSLYLVFLKGLKSYLNSQR
ncbi:TetR/AcrR family transcriptional regulator [Chryseobacterium cheonjiense]|uniref:TetR/AcrR family transcriptional regulator n=1 Tax=Chryseobacterium cheonjiense TaxID=2728845 RepID=A0A7Y0A408_9FLAO|nr:TetR/AcrR family transcriptional regulator [Chryseobacterium cheonjiense]NML56298.1 TetR/AcrR family transcriptional regulator [Chryseobacterium cheonjiense]